MIDFGRDRRLGADFDFPPVAAERLYDKMVFTRQ